MAANSCSAIDPAAIDELLATLQSHDNAVRIGAEARLQECPVTPVLLNTLMDRVLLAPQIGSRQLAATLLSWRLPKLWAELPSPGQHTLQIELLGCFSRCNELPVLRQLGETCNALSQAFALRHNALWEELLQMVNQFISAQDSSKPHQRASLELLASLVESMGLRLNPFYQSIANGLTACVRNPDADIRVAALGAIAALASSWCVSAADLQPWLLTADAVFEVAACASGLSPSPQNGGSPGGPRVLSAALRALACIVPLLRAESKRVVDPTLELVCHVLGHGKSGGVTRIAEEQCQVQALQALRSIALKAPELLSDRLTMVVVTVCRVTKEDAPSCDDLDEVSGVSQAARDCLRGITKNSVLAQQALPVVLEFARGAAQSVDAMDRAAALHSVAFALAGVREAEAGWSQPFVRGLADSTVWVRQAAYETLHLLAEALKPSPAAAEGQLLLLRAVCERIPSEPSPELLRKAAEATAALFKELSTDDAAAVLSIAIPSLLQALSAAQAAFAASQDPADATAAAAVVAAVACALGAAASAATDRFAPYAASAAAVLLPPLRAGFGGGVPPHVAAACLEAAGAVVASAWEEAEFRQVREELAMVAQQQLASVEAASEVRAGAHIFFSHVAFASFEQFAPLLASVVPPALDALRPADGSECVGSISKRAVRTGGFEERVAAVEALGAYAASVGGAFAVHLPLVLPAICSLARHPGTKVRSAVCRSLAQIGLCLGSIAGSLAGSTSADGVAAATLAQTLTRALVGLLTDSSVEGASLRCALQAYEDLSVCHGFVSLVGPAEVAVLSSAAAGRSSEDVESSEDEMQDDDEEDS
eukprot:TRINITY_DN7316_c0_g2_i1.p1 TRINITY_DN7316_c0_g2~~TRINITY_DN7316_c0_g2_i1.p1  ORF type:complete len:827 (-),score=145.02 TRINITY_DN7316_c0_g2_i1:445-2925(-)